MGRGGAFLRQSILPHSDGGKADRDGSPGNRSASFIRALQLPEDCRKGEALITLEGQERVRIENFRGISSYTQEEIRLITRKKKLCVAGRRLKIDSYSKDEIEISGVIESIGFL